LVICAAVLLHLLVDVYESISGRDAWRQPRHQREVPMNRNGPGKGLPGQLLVWQDSRQLGVRRRAEQKQKSE
jgi:hypothetical protein